MKRNIVIGPPGTGKTTFLKNKVDKLINEGHCRPNEIGYFSFIKCRRTIELRKKTGQAELKDVSVFGTH